ncbi:MAG: DinB family protein [Ignavibacteriales bacterium]|nr:DinB family protein [Ignavibacteriales bacterium]
MSNIKSLKSVEHVTNEYTKRILSNTIGKEVIQVLSETPNKLKKLVKGLSKGQLTKRPGKNKWSIAEIIGHLGDTELILGFRIRLSLSESGSPLQPIEQDDWVKNHRYNSRDVKNALEAFTALRKFHVSIYSSLSKNELERFGIHQERGKETVEFMIRLVAGHDLNHLMQIEALRKKWLRK